MDAAPITRVACAAYLANCTLGTAVRMRLVDTAAHRWVHHALFVVTATATVAAVAAGIRRASGLALVPALVPLAVIPYSGSARHVGTALAAAPWYGVALAATGRD